MSTTKTGKHGHAKMKIIGIDVLTGKKYEEMTPKSALEAGDNGVVVAVLGVPEGTTHENCNLVEIVIDARLPSRR
jgi:hypothetical protein